MARGAVIVNTDEMPSWFARGACVNSDVDFFPGPADFLAMAAAKAVCASCPIEEACLEWALTRREQYGVWGGASERQRRRMRRERRAG